MLSGGVLVDSKAADLNSGGSLSMKTRKTKFKLSGVFSSPSVLAKYPVFKKKGKKNYQKNKINFLFFSVFKKSSRPGV